MPPATTNTVSSVTNASALTSTISPNESLPQDSIKVVSSTAAENQDGDSSEELLSPNTINSGSAQPTATTDIPTFFGNATDLREFFGAGSSKSARVDPTAACCGCILSMKTCSKITGSDACDRCIWLRGLKPGIAVPCVYAEGFSRDKFYKAGHKMPSFWKVRNTDPSTTASASAATFRWDVGMSEPAAKRQNTYTTHDGPVISTAVQERARSTTSPMVVITSTSNLPEASATKSVPKQPVAQSMPQKSTTSTVSSQPSEPNTHKALVSSETQSPPENSALQTANGRPKGPSGSGSVSDSPAAVMPESIIRASASTFRAAGHSVSSANDLSVKEISKRLEGTIEFHQKLYESAAEGEMLKSVAGTTATKLENVLTSPKLKRFRSQEIMIEEWKTGLEAQKRPLFETNLADCRAYLGKKDWSK